jgi:hypothetical protein
MLLKLLFVPKDERIHGTFHPTADKSNLYAKKKQAGNERIS